MARDLILIERERPIYSENLLPPFCTFDDVHTWNIVDGPAEISVSSSDEYRYAGERSIKVIMITTEGGTFDSGGTEMNVTAPANGSYILSTGLLIPTAFDTADTDIYIQCFVNGILLLTNELNANLYPYSTGDPENPTAGWEWGVWNIYAQTIQLNEGDILSFRIKVDTDSAGTELFIDRFKLELDDKQLEIPSIYSLPKDFCCSDGKVNLVETQWDVPDVGPQVVANGAALNLLTLIDNATHKNSTNSDTFDQLNIVSNAIKTTYRGSKTIHLVRLSFNILVGTDQFYQIQIRRAIDDSVVYRLQIQRNADESIQTVEMTTRTLSASDPFTIDGFYVAFVNNSGASVTIDDSLSLVVISTYQKQQTP